MSALSILKFNFSVYYGLGLIPYIVALLLFLATLTYGVVFCLRKLR